MLFTSFSFAVFLFLVFFLYWFLFRENSTYQNLFLLFCSYLFYGWWDWRFLVILFAISFSNYFLAILIQKSEKRHLRKIFFLISLTISIGTLVVFKYFSFFINGFINIFSLFGFHLDQVSVSLILPIGISFYTFLTISYIIEVYQKKIIAEKNIFQVMLAFSFFPIILAGPIQRPNSMLPQIKNPRIFNAGMATDGLKQILWGVFMKILIADRCDQSVNAIFSNSNHSSGSTLLLGVFLFTIQIYADFSGYSNIAIGVAKLLGFKIMKNFGYPYFARDIREFWQRWNISLTSWFRDYVFLPVAYYVSGKIKSEKIYFIKTEFIIYLTGILVTWTLTGLWHGANYTFIIWGMIHGFFLVIYHVTVKPRKSLFKRYKISNNNSLLIFFESVITFGIIMFSWIFFRADNIGQAFHYISQIFSASLLSVPHFSGKKATLITLGIIAVAFAMEWAERKNDYALSSLGARWPRAMRWGLYYCLVIAILVSTLSFSGSQQQFIYFQF